MVRLAFALTGKPDLAEDVVQDAFALLHAKLEGVNNPGAYLRMTVVNLCRNRERRRRQDRQLDARLQRPQLSSLGASEMVDVLLLLPYRQRAVLVLRYWGDWSEAEISFGTPLPPRHGQGSRFSRGCPPEEGTFRMNCDIEGELRSALEEFPESHHWPIRSAHGRLRSPPLPRHHVDVKTLTLAGCLVVLIGTVVAIGVENSHQRSHRPSPAATTSTLPPTTSSLPQPGPYVVPSVVGLTSLQAVGELQSAGLTNSIDNLDCPGSISEGRVVGQNPPAGFRAASDSRVNLRISCSTTSATTSRG